MKKFIRILILLVTIPTIGMLIAATISALMHDSALEKENSELREKITALNSTINNLKSEAPLLFSKALDQQKRNQFPAARSTLADLSIKHPDFRIIDVAATLKGIDAAEKAFQEAQKEADGIRIKEMEKAKNEAIRMAEKRRIEAEQSKAEADKVADQKRIEDAKQAANRAKNLAIAVKSLVKKTDEIKEVDWYRDAGTKETNNQKNVHAYIGSAKGQVWLRFKMCYNADDWLFVKSVSFKVDDQTTSLNYGLFNDWERDNASGDIWEWKDSIMDAKSWALINSIADSKKTIMRYEGRQYQFDREIELAEKKSLKNIINAFEAMGGVAPN